MEKSHKEINHTQLLHQKIYWTYLNLESVPVLVRNINTDDGLVNGAFGTITGLEKSSDNIIKAVYIRFDHP